MTTQLSAREYHFNKVKAAVSTGSAPESKHRQATRGDQLSLQPSRELWLNRFS